MWLCPAEALERKIHKHLWWHSFWGGRHFREHVAIRLNESGWRLDRAQKFAEEVVYLHGYRAIRDALPQHWASQPHEVRISGNIWPNHFEIQEKASEPPDAQTQSNEQVPSAIWRPFKSSSQCRLLIWQNSVDQVWFTKHQYQWRGWRRNRRMWGHFLRRYERVVRRIIRHTVWLRLRGNKKVQKWPKGETGEQNDADQA